jgi:hypothetical protein
MYQLSMQYFFFFRSQEVAEVERRLLKACSWRWGHLLKETRLEILLYCQMFKLYVVSSFSNSRTIHYLVRVERIIIFAWVATLLIKWLVWNKFHDKLLEMRFFKFGRCIQIWSVFWIFSPGLRVCILKEKCLLYLSLKQIVTDFLR